ncbi:recombination mediator RecR [Entomobacter blattae]|uniref:Recombination protein RecR n=1 Tax=Entomobacter blattae TaxID=2762277 RepID=A0A7H1NTJ0_9PROT|nr:recombination mediator RecR [Entomobacter blattae]QNT79100.1 Recombination protein RecR [Entomobacter blattae]
MRISPEIESLLSLLSRLPGLGPRSARRVVLALLKNPQGKMLSLAQALEQAASTVKTCSVCGNVDSSDPCLICSDPTRDQSVVCVVETVGDLWALENSGLYRGSYQVLGGVLSPLAGQGPEDLNSRSLFHRIEEGRVKEVILALSVTVDGVTTMHWLQEKLKPFAVAVSQLGQGVPMGSTLEGLDDGTIAAAFAARKVVNG